MKPFSIVVLISGDGSNLQSIIDRIADQSLNVKILAVISNKANAYGIERAKKAQLPIEIIEHQNYASREIFDAQLIQIINQYQPQLIVLAGFMRILSDDFVHYFYGKMINIHPSLLPKYRGLNTHQQVLEAGDSQHGLTIHFVSSQLDGGPIILQQSIAVQKHDTVEILAKRLLLQEHIAYPNVIQWFSEGRITLDNKHVSIQSLHNL